MRSGHVIHVMRAACAQLLLLGAVSQSPSKVLVHGSPGTELVAKLQDRLAAGFVEDPAAAAVAAVERSVRQALRDDPGTIKELLDDIGNALADELTQSMFEDTTAGNKELEGLHNEFRACQYRSASSKGLSVDDTDALTASHKDCRNTEADALLAFMAKCDTAILNVKEESKILLDAEATAFDSADCMRMARSYRQQQAECNAAQDHLDSTVCSRRQTTASCNERMGCEARVREAMLTAIETIDAHEREYLGLTEAKSSVSCLVAALHTGVDNTEEALQGCQKGEGNLTHRRPARALHAMPPAMTPCVKGVSFLEQESELNSGVVLDYGNLPRAAPPKDCSSPCCLALMQKEAQSPEDQSNASNHDDHYDNSDKPPPFTLNGCTSWYKSEEATIPWPSSIGSYQGTVIDKRAEAIFDAGAGSTGKVQFVRGDENTTFDFGPLLSESYTICSATRYWGAPYERILQGAQSNWLHGHVAGSAGVSCAGQPQQNGTAKEDWAVVCATSDDSREALVNGKVIENATCSPQNVKQKQNLVINHGQAWSQRSKWAVAEIITWDRVLTTAEMSTAGDYLNKKIKNGIELDLKIVGPDGSCNGKRVQVEMAPKEPPNGWRHSPELGDPKDRSPYQLQDAKLGSFKVLEDALPMVSERSSGEVVAPWGHSSLKGTGFVFIGNSAGPKLLSFFGIDAAVTVRVTANGTDMPDVSVGYGGTSTVEGNFENSRVKIMATHNILAAMSGPSGQFSTPLGPAATSIYGILRDDWHVTTLGGAAANITQECWDGTSQNHSSSTIKPDVVTKSGSASLIEAEHRAVLPGWFLAKSTLGLKTCSGTCAAMGLRCAQDASLISSENKLKTVAESLGVQCSSITGPFRGKEAPTVSVNGSCKYSDASSPLQCDAETPDNSASRLCYCENPTSGEDYYSLSNRSTNECPTGYMAITTRAACETAANLGTMPGVPAPIAWSPVDPNNQGSPSGCFKNLETGNIQFNSISFTGYTSLDAWQTEDHRKICKNIKLLQTAEPICKFTAIDDQVFLGGLSYDFTGSSAVTFLPPGVFQSETKLPMDAEKVKLVSAKENTCKVRGKKYEFYGKGAVFQGLIEKKLKAHDIISCKQPVMAVSYRDMGDVSMEAPRMNMLSATACKASSKRGVRGLVVDTTLYLEHGFVFTKVLEKNANGDLFTIPEADFNENLKPWSKYPLVKRICSSCAASHTEIFYRRFTSAESLSLYKTLACAWNSEPGNEADKDFKLFSKLDDALADENSWTSCSFAPKGTGRGFPWQCGPSSPVVDQWNSIAVDGTNPSGTCRQEVDAGGRSVSFYMLLPIVPQEWRFGMKIEKDRITSIPESEFNLRFQQSRYHIILRRCQECSKAYKTVAYRRFTLTDTFEPYKTLACDWQEGIHNRFMIDFKLYSNVQDALTDNHAWTVCDFDGSGFPGQCKPNDQVHVGKVQSYIRVDGCPAGASSKSVTFEIYEDIPIDTSEISPDDADALAAVNSRDAQLPDATPPDEGMVAWFRSEDSGPTWRSAIGSYTATEAGGVVGTSERYYGSDIKHIWGDSKASFSFGNIIPSSTFTMCSVSAYTGAQQGQVLRAENWWHGHNAGQSGSVCYKEWVREQKNQSGIMKWLTLCASNQHESVFIEGRELPATFVGTGGGVRVSINDGSPEKRSDWAVAEVITWDRVLTQSEMIDTQNYLRGKVKSCQPQQNALCDQPPCVSLFVGPNRHNVMFRNDDGSATVRTETGQDVSCVCSGFCAGLVGRWNCDGGPFGGQYSISTDYGDDWTSETDKDSLLLCSVARPSWSKKMQVASTDLPLQIGSVSDHIQNTSFSLVAAIRRISGLSAGPQTIFATGQPADRLEFVVKPDQSFFISFSGRECLSRQASVEGVWQHVAFVFDMSKLEGRFYLNGLEVATCSDMLTYLSTAQVLQLSGTTNPWQGEMKEVAVYPETLHPAMVHRLAGEMAMKRSLVWYSYRDNWSRRSYVQAIRFCAEKKMKLAQFQDLCVPDESGNLSMQPKAAPGDQWAPFAGGEDNSWVQIGDGAKTMKPTPTCKTYKEQFGSQPDWGRNGKPHRHKAYLACKSMHNFMRVESDGGKGRCESGADVPFESQVASEEACKMQCLKENSCRYATFTPEDAATPCKLSSKCDFWEATDKSTSWAKKPLR